jgi:hypothetical protein
LVLTIILSTTVFEGDWALSSGRLTMLATVAKEMRLILPEVVVWELASRFRADARRAQRAFGSVGLPLGSPKIDVEACVEAYERHLASWAEQADVSIQAAPPIASGPLLEKAVSRALPEGLDYHHAILWETALSELGDGAQVVLVASMPEECRHERVELCDRRKLFARYVGLVLASRAIETSFGLAPPLPLQLDGLSLEPGPPERTTGPSLVSFGEASCETLAAYDLGDEIVAELGVQLKNAMLEFLCLQSFAYPAKNDSWWVDEPHWDRHYALCAARVDVLELGIVARFRAQDRHLLSFAVESAGYPAEPQTSSKDSSYWSDYWGDSAGDQK